MCLNVNTVQKWYNSQEIFIEPFFLKLEYAGKNFNAVIVDGLATEGDRLFAAMVFL